MLEVKNLSFSIKNKRILKDISFRSSKGEVRAIIGPNGAGKTTLLKVISNIYKKDTGSIRLNGKEISLLRPKELSRIVSYLPQFSEVPELSVLEVLELGRYTYSGFKIKNTDRMVIDNIIKSFNLERILDKSISKLSGGERQKVLLASSLVQEPQILILDEPISYLDPKNQIDVLRVIKNLTRERNIITLIVLHDIQHALHYGDKLLIMKDGEVIYDMDASKLNEKHLNRTFDINTKLIKEEKRTFVCFY